MQRLPPSKFLRGQRDEWPHAAFRLVLHALQNGEVNSIKDGERQDRLDWFDLSGGPHRRTEGFPAKTNVFERDRVLKWCEAQAAAAPKGQQTVRVDDLPPVNIASRKENTAKSPNEKLVAHQERWITKR